MRIHFITAGAAAMYCGSCIRDNALAAELMAQGHQVLLIPVYTPTLTDERNVSQARVFFGGISVYLQQYVPLFRTSPRWLDRLWDSPAVLALLSKFSIETDPRFLGEMTISMLRGEDGHLNKEFQKLLAWLQTQPRPDVVSLPFTLLIGLAAPLRRALGCAVVCTLQGEDLFLNGLAELYRTESLELIRAHIADVDTFIAVSEYYADFMSGYVGIPRHKIHVVPLGINLNGYERVPRTADEPFTIGYFSRVAPEKGLHTLCEAYRILRQERGFGPARLEAAGYISPEDKPYLLKIERQMEQEGLAQEFNYRGVLDREQKIRFLQALDVLSVPSSYAEPKGLFLLEAMACGVPVVQPRHGAYPEILARTGGGLLCEPENPGSLADVLFSLWKDAALTEELGRRGFDGVRQHYAVSQVARRTVEVFSAVVSTTGKSASAMGA